MTSRFLQNLLASCFLLVALLCSIQASASASSSDFAVAPYVLSPNATSAIVAFHLRQPANATVSVVIDGQPKQFSSPKQTSHFVRITGLQPSQAYGYSVQAENGAATARQHRNLIRTAARKGESFSFVVYGDPRPGQTETHRHHKEVIERAALQEPAFALILGDMVDDGSRPELWEDFFKVEAPLAARTALFPVKGDNDNAEGKGLVTNYFPILEKGYYSFEWGGSHFFGLNAWDTRGIQPENEYGPGSEQLQWLESQLSREDVQNAPFRVIFLHDPVYISRGRAAELLQGTLAPIFEKYRVDAVFASWHIYERQHRGGVSYIISGGAGAEIIWMPPNKSYPAQADAAQYHFVRVDVQPEVLTMRAISAEGTVLDEFAIAPRAQSAERGKTLQKNAARLRRNIIIGDAEAPQMPIALFATQCSFCKKLLNVELPRLARKNNIAFAVDYYDLSIKGSYELFLAAGTNIGRQDADLPAIFAGGRVHGGETEILGNIEQEIERFRKQGAAYPDARSLFNEASGSGNNDELRQTAFDALTLGIVIAAGLLDGLNPCAFATVVFLVSYLGLMGASDRRTLMTGGLFILGVYTAYFGIGLLFFHSLSSIVAATGLASALNKFLIAISALLCSLSLYDAARLAAGKSEQSLFGMPKFFSERVHEGIRQHAVKGAVGLVTPLMLGMLVASIELTCTGQVYLPIVSMLAEPAYRMQALGYLTMYNLAFISPLVAVFALAYTGRASFTAARNPQFKALIKLAQAAFFAAMIGLLLYNAGVI